jgi:hypothetical protein
MPLRFLACIILLVSMTGAYAHQVGESYLFLKVFENHLEGRVHTTVSDLDDSLSIDANGDGKVTEDELKAKLTEATNYISNHVGIAAEGQPLELDYTGYEMLKISLGQYVVFKYRTPDLAAVPDIIDVRMSVFFDSDPKQRARVVLEENAKTGEINNVERVALDFVPGDSDKPLDLTQKYSPLNEFRRFVWEGIWHIWIGLDHILFLAALVLPAVLILSNSEWSIVANFRPALWNVVKIVTCFTVAHSITFSLAALGVVSLSSRVVESIIALSVFLAAMNNIWPVVKQHTWVIVFVFGLFHGFGFASVFGDLLSDDALVVPLIGFNVGVEVGQVAILLALFPILFVLRDRKDIVGVAVLIGAALVIAYLIAEPWWILVAISLLFPVLYVTRSKNKPYIHAILYGGSAVIALRALAWFIERAFDLG